MSGPGRFDHIVEMFAGFGAVEVRRMFGGAGIFAQGLMIGLVVRDVIYLKADELTRGDFEREGLGCFSYATPAGRRSIASFRRMPERLYDDPDELAVWAGKALDCARRGAARKQPPGRGPAARRSRVSKAKP